MGKHEESEAVLCSDERIAVPRGVQRLPIACEMQLQISHVQPHHLKLLTKFIR